VQPLLTLPFKVPGHMPPRENGQQRDGRDGAPDE